MQIIFKPVTTVVVDVYAFAQLVSNIVETVTGGTGTVYINQLHFSYIREL